ncbi:MAG: dihydrodipicolinate synthase family protein [Spirochaetes bacterium GWF1_41_5]|nr:MAG: dihydrodipicolinate synthase family protein [Spirochaetes bacterium GWF1_41_5]
MSTRHIPEDLLHTFKHGTVIPAMPLALDKERKFNEKHQRALLRYYIDAGAGGIAVGVHSTQFEIRDPNIRLFEPVLSFALREINAYSAQKKRSIFKIAGVCGKTEQASNEARFAAESGYHACLLSLSAFKDNSIDEMLAHCGKIASILPLIGFYLQPSVGGRVLPYEFWRKFFEIPDIIGVKMAPFNRYQTFDVVHALCESGRENEITLYTGNDDNIVVDLLSEYCIHTKTGDKPVRIRGGLLGHWCVWTKKAVELLDEIRRITGNGAVIPKELLTRALQITDANAAFFDAKNNFAGCIPGLHEVLRRQGIFEGTWCLNTHETLSQGQSDEITRVYESYPHLNDDEFVRTHLAEWLL